jgi:glutathione S-transferase
MSCRTVLEDIHRHLGAIDVLLRETPYLVGESLSLADISVFVRLDCMAQLSEGKTAIDS